MASSTFVRALVQIAEEEGNTASLEEIRNKAFEKISQGESKTLISSSVQGKSFNFSLSKSADILFAEVSEAIRIYNQGTNSFTVLDFSGV